MKQIDSKAKPNPLGDQPLGSRREDETRSDRNMVKQRQMKQKATPLKNDTQHVSRRGQTDRGLQPLQ